MSVETLLRECRLALKRGRQIPSEKRMLIEKINRYLNTPRRYWDRQTGAAGERLFEKEN